MVPKISLLEFADKIGSSVGISTLRDFKQYSLFDHSEEERRKDEECFRHVFTTLKIYFDSEKKVFVRIKGNDRDHFYPINQKAYFPTILSIQKCIEDHLKTSFFLEEEEVELYFEEREALDFLASTLNRQKPSRKEMLEKCEQYFGGLTSHIKVMLCIGDSYSVPELETLNGLKEKNVLSVLKKKIDFTLEELTEEEVFRICRSLLIEDYHCTEAGPQKK